MEKNCIIIHGCPSHNEKSMDPEKRTYDKHWIPWIKKELISKNMDVETPLMPEPWKPNYLDWKIQFEKNDINENTILVGHSCGGGFLVRWLGDTGKKVKKLILVAPAILHPEEWKPLENLLRFDINENVKKNVDERLIFVSEDDSKGILESVNIFEKELDANVIRFKEHGHFTQEDMGKEEFPELLNKIIEDN